MFRFFYSKNIRIAVLLSLILAKAALAQTGLQTDPQVIWQTDSGGVVLAYSADGKLLLASTRLLSAADGTVLRDFHLPYNGGGTNAVAISPDGQYAAIGIQGFNQNLDLFRVSDGALMVGRITAHLNGTTSVAFSPDGQLLATGGRDGTAKLWRVPDMTLLTTLNGGNGYRPRVFAVAFTLDGSMLVVGGQGGMVMYRIADGQLVREFTGAASTRALTISPDNQFVANGTNVIDQQGQCADCAVKTWRIADGALLQVIDTENNEPISIAYSPKGNVIAAGSEDRVAGDGLLRFWRSMDGVLLKSFNVGDNNPDSTAYVTSVAYSPDGKFLAYATIDHHVVVIQNPIEAKKVPR